MNTMITRRYLLRFAGLFGVGSALPASPLAAAQKKAAVPAAVAEPNVYASIGVRPLINCRGTLTIIGGSVELPEVRAAKTAANQQYAQLDEVMDGVGQRLAISGARLLGRSLTLQRQRQPHQVARASGSGDAVQQRPRHRHRCAGDRRSA